MASALGPARHVIGVVARRTGLRADRIRGWERRYGAVTPARSASGRRLYTDAEVERLRLLRVAVDCGHAIGSVAHLDDEGLVRLVAADGAEGEGPVDVSQVRPSSARGSDAEAIVERALAAIRRLDRCRLEAELARASMLLPFGDLMEGVLEPLMVRVGELWRGGQVRPVQEHMASAVLRSFVVNLVGRGRIPEDGPKLVVATPLRQRHELGAVAVAACAVKEGWQAIYLGPEVAAEEIAAAADIGGVRIVAVSITFPPGDEVVSAELQRLGELLPPGVELLVGGRGAGTYGKALGVAGGRLVRWLGELRTTLAETAGEESRSPLR